MIEVGSQAPDFTLKDQNGKSVRLSSLKGKRVLLSFRPLAWTPV
jgi:peroxiredoxin